MACKLEILQEGPRCAEGLTVGIYHPNTAHQKLFAWFAWFGWESGDPLVKVFSGVTTIAGAQAIAKRMESMALRFKEKLAVLP